MGRVVESGPAVSAQRNIEVARALLLALPEGHRGASTLLFVGREINDLPKILEERELPIRAGTGLLSGSSVLFVATDRRVLILDRERHKTTTIRIDYPLIESVERRRGKFTITTSDGRAITVTDVATATLTHFADWLRVQVAGARAFEHVVTIESSRPPQVNLPPGPQRVLPGGYEVNVVGESFHADELRAVVGPAGGSFGATLAWASLVPEFDNPYDVDAVKVLVEGRHVGYLSKDAAKTFAPVAARIRELMCDARCAATIMGGGEDGVFGVVLDLGKPDDCLKGLC